MMPSCNYTEQFFYSTYIHNLANFNALPTESKQEVIATLTENTQDFLQKKIKSYFPLSQFMFKKLNLSALIHRLEEGVDADVTLSQIKKAGNLLNFVAIVYKSPLQQYEDESFEIKIINDCKGREQYFTVKTTDNIEYQEAINFNYQAISMLIERLGNANKLMKLAESLYSAQSDYEINLYHKIYALVQQTYRQGNLFDEAFLKNSEAQTQLTKAAHKMSDEMMMYRDKIRAELMPSNTSVKKQNITA